MAVIKKEEVISCVLVKLSGVEVLGYKEEHTQVAGQWFKSVVSDFKALLLCV